MTLAFAHSEIDRSAHLRKDEVALAAMRASDRSQLIETAGDAVVLHHGKLGKSGEISENAVFLGLDPNGVAWFASAAKEGAELTPIRQILSEGLLSQQEISHIAQARSLVHWHEKHGFCAACGAKSDMSDGGYRRHCAVCSTDHFPRTDPVVIMVVQHSDRFLLGRQAAWPENMFSALAGFMEPGETIEQAVAREVMEETGIAVGKVRYVSSQPWPFPSSLMIGMIAEATSDQITIDHDELQDARWFSREDLKLMLVGKHPDGLWAARPYAIAHQILREAVRN